MRFNHYDERYRYPARADQKGRAKREAIKRQSDLPHSLVKEQSSLQQNVPHGSCAQSFGRCRVPPTIGKRQAFVGDEDDVHKVAGVNDLMGGRRVMVPSPTPPLRLPYRSTISLASSPSEMSVSIRRFGCSAYTVARYRRNRRMAPGG